MVKNTTILDLTNEAKLLVTQPYIDYMGKLSNLQTTYIDANTHELGDGIVQMGIKCYDLFEYLIYSYKQYEKYYTQCCGDISNLYDNGLKQLYRSEEVGCTKMDIDINKFYEFIKLSSGTKSTSSNLKLSRYSRAKCKLICEGMSTFISDTMVSVKIPLSNGDYDRMCGPIVCAFRMNHVKCSFTINHEIVNFLTPLYVDVDVSGAFGYKYLYDSFVLDSKNVKNLYTVLCKNIDIIATLGYTININTLANYLNIQLVSREQKANTLYKGNNVVVYTHGEFFNKLCTWLIQINNKTYLAKAKGNIVMDYTTTPTRGRKPKVNNLVFTTDK